MSNGPAPTIPDAPLSPRSASDWPRSASSTLSRDYSYTSLDPTLRLDELAELSAPNSLIYDHDPVETRSRSASAMAYSAPFSESYDRPLSAPRANTLNHHYTPPRVRREEPTHPA